MAIEIAPPELALPAMRKRLRDRRALWRFCAWGGSAAIALAAVAITTQTESGSERIQLAFENLPAHAAVMADVALRAVEKDAETQRLEGQLRALAADRDRLTARLASLEHDLDDVTGSIKRQAALAAAVPPAASPAPAPSAPATTLQIASAPPAASAHAAVPAASAPVQPVIAPLAMPASSDTSASWPNGPQPQTATPKPDAVPLPPIRVASAPATEPAAEPPPPKKIELGVDIGGAPNLALLNARWAAVKANFGPLLTGLQPVAAQVHHPGAPTYRLVVGPLPNAAAAAQLCSQFAAARVICRPAKYDGERLAQR
jgi:hypothetical protein